jgi:hypothetical protein
MKWAIYDTVDNLWIGNDHGPLIYDDDPEKPLLTGEFMAKAAAQVAAMQLDYSPTRLRAREWVDTTTRLRDEVQTKMTPLQALKRIEDGHL